MLHKPDVCSAIKRTRSSIAQFSLPGIDRSSQPIENCHPSFRSVLLPIYPVWTPSHLLPQGAKGELGICASANLQRRRFAVSGDVNLKADGSVFCAYCSP